MKCHECGAEAFETKTLKLYTKVGTQKVEDGSMCRPVCLSCGAFVLSAQDLEHVELRATHVVFREAPSVNGAMLKFARKALGLKQDAFARELGTSAESISRWENGARPIEQWIRRAVIGLVLDRLNPVDSKVHLQRATG